jgi:hypothetical protein
VTNEASRARHVRPVPIADPAVKAPQVLSHNERLEGAGPLSARARQRQGYASRWSPVRRMSWCTSKGCPPEEHGL